MADCSMVKYARPVESSVGGAAECGIPQGEGWGKGGEGRGQSAGGKGERPKGALGPSEIEKVHSTPVEHPKGTPVKYASLLQE